MRYLAILILLSALGCSESQPSGRVDADADVEHGDGHFLQSQQDALEKAKQTAAALEAATHRIERD